MKLIGRITEKNKQFIPKWLKYKWAFFVCFLILCLIFFFSSISSFCEKNSDFLLVFVTAIYVLVTTFILISNKKSTELLAKQNKNQHFFWRKEAYIRYECEIIVQLKKLYEDISSDYSQFNRFALMTLFGLPFGNFLTKEKAELWLKKLKIINQFCQENEPILKKYALKDNFFYFQKYEWLLASTIPHLDTVQHFNYHDVNLKVGDVTPEMDKSTIAFQPLYWFIFIHLITKEKKEGFTQYNPSLKDCIRNFSKEEVAILEEFRNTSYIALDNIRNLLWDIMDTTAEV